MAGHIETIIRTRAISVVLMICTVVTHLLRAAANSSPTLAEFSLQPLDIASSFNRQSLTKSSKYPFLTPQGAIFLTQDPSDSARNQPLYNVGRITYRKPLPFKDDRGPFHSFHTSFTFQINTSTKYNESGDGIAFAITTDKAPPINCTGRFLGLMPEKPKDRHERFMALEFDTFQNLQPEIRDPSASHIGIDISSLSSIHPILNTSDPSDPLYLYNNYTITAWLSYNSSTHLIQVWAINSSQQQRPSKPVLSVTQDLSKLFENDTDIYVAITAASGNNSQANILYSWNFTIVAEANQDGNPHLYKRLCWFLLIVSVPLALLAAAVVQATRRREFDRQRRAAIKDASISVHRYKYTELKRATQNFSKQRMIGRGGFSVVYKGILPDESAVAVKKMKDGLAEADEIDKEVQIISKIKHRNLLELEGWCYERRETLLVFKYMPNGSLDSYLYGDKRRSGKVLDSKTRFKIIMDVAAGLEYLHNGLEEYVLHRDVKAANVLLTETMEAKLGDFGLARLVAHDEIVMTMPMGTPGYVPPEIHTSRVSEKADVYSFGVLILEIACGQRPLDPMHPTYSRLVDRVWLHHQKTTIMEALDPSLAQTILVMPSSAEADQAGEETDEVSRLELEKWRCVLHLGVICCQTDPDTRPDMREVLQVLKYCTILPLPTSWTSYPPQSSPMMVRPITQSTSSVSTLQYFSFPSHNLGS